MQRRHEQMEKSQDTEEAVEGKEKEREGDRDGRKDNYSRMEAWVEGDGC